MRYTYTEEDVEFIEQNYDDNGLYNIMEKFPNLTIQAIYSKMSKLGYKYKGIHSLIKLDKILNWSDEEDKIIRSMYPCHSIEDIHNLMLDRSIFAISVHARRLGLKQHNSSTTKWTQKDEQYIIDNWKLEPDKVMAKKLNRTFRSVKWKREGLGLYRRDMNSNTYPTITKYLRGQNQKWKVDSMKQCNYQCVLTGGKDFEIHHLYGVSNIVEDLFKEYKNLYKESFSDYTDEELSFILTKFLEIQSSYPLGECIDKKLHTLFHSLYGQYYNTPEQWRRFKEDYLKGIYNNID